MRGACAVIYNITHSRHSRRFSRFECSSWTGGKKKKLSGRAREGRETEKTDSLFSPSPALSSYSVTTGVTFVILMLGLESDPLS